MPSVSRLLETEGIDVALLPAIGVPLLGFFVRAVHPCVVAVHSFINAKAGRLDGLQRNSRLGSGSRSCLVAWSSW